MAAVPYFIFSPNVILSTVGLIHGPDKTRPTPGEDWRQATVDVVIPTFNEEKNIAVCLSSLAKQTLKPRKIYVVDDGSKDRTIEYVRSFSQINELDVEIIERKKSIGKTPTLKIQSRQTDSDVEFVLDGDTILESPDYIERTVKELYQAAGIGSACGTILPIRQQDRMRMIDTQWMKKFLHHHPDAPVQPRRGFLSRLSRGITNMYRDALYMFLQKFVYRGQMTFFGSVINPVGCAVAYRREYIKDLFDQYEPVLGDDLTNSEDIFIGFALANKGYRNIQLGDVYARTVEPSVTRLPRQIYLWSSSFLQSCYYFNDLMKSPFKALKRRRHRRQTEKEDASLKEKRKIDEPYRQPFGDDFTRIYGRPIGWVPFMGAIEKITFPITLLVLMVLGLWEPLLITVVIETLLSAAVLLFVARRPGWNEFMQDRPGGLEYILKVILLTPIRYSILLFDLVTILIFLSHLWVFKTRKWRK